MTNRTRNLVQRSFFSVRSSLARARRCLSARVSISRTSAVSGPCIASDTESQRIAGSVAAGASRGNTLCRVLPQVVSASLSAKREMGRLTASWWREGCRQRARRCVTGTEPGGDGPCEGRDHVLRYRASRLGWNAFGQESARCRLPARVLRDRSVGWISDWHNAELSIQLKHCWEGFKHGVET